MWEGFSEEGVRGALFAVDERHQVFVGGVEEARGHAQVQGGEGVEVKIDHLAKFHREALEPRRDS